MNISWHLLFEQLQRNPALQEELAGEFATLSSQTEVSAVSEEKEAEAIQQLQRRLGNTGLQKLIAQYNAQMTTPDAMKMTESKVDASAGKLNNTTSPEEKVLFDNAENKEVPVEMMVKPDSSENESVQDNSIRKAPDPAIGLGKLLQQFISALPGPVLANWKNLSELFDQLPAVKQSSVVSVIAKRVQSLPEVQQHRFVKIAQNLPRGLAQTAFVSALTAKLLSLVPTAPEVEVPVEPGE